MESKLLDKVTGAFELDLPSDLQTMPQFIEFIVPKVQPWSEDLREEKFYVGKRWVEIQDRDAWDKSFIHIFMDGGEYLFSDNGILTRKTWRYLAESNIFRPGRR